MAATQQITLTVPLGTQLHNNSDPHLICRDTRWTDVAVFYIGNYVAHVATVRTVPGELISSVVTTLLCCLFFPVNGISRGLKAIWSLSFCYIWKGQNLRAVTRAGALCMVVRDIDWEPSVSGGDKVSYCRMATQIPNHGIHHDDIANAGNASRAVDSESGISLCVSMMEQRASLNSNRQVLTAPVANQVFTKLTFYCPFGVGQVNGIMLELTRNIHGSYSLPKGYTLATVPVDAKVRWFETRELPNVGRTADEVVQSRAEANASRSVDDIAYSGSLVKAVVSIFQLLFAVASLYRTSGNQIDKFGYAAFGLTVSPYAVMSFINLLANALAVEFPKLYMVHSPVMEEALTRGGSFGAVVGSLVPGETHASTTMVSGIIRTVQDDSNQYVFESQDVCGSAANENCITQPEIEETGSDNEAAKRAPGCNSMTTARETSYGQRDAADCCWKPRPGVLAIPICEPIDRHELSSFRKWWETIQPIDRNHTIIGQRNDWVEEKLPGHSHFATDEAWLIVSNLFWIGLTPYIPAVACLAIIGGLSRWRKGQSTLPQRVWTMIWLVFGFLFNLVQMAEQDGHAVRQLYATSASRTSRGDTAMLKKDRDEEMGPRHRLASRFEGHLRRFGGSQMGLAFVLGGLVYAAPAVGGFVVVGQMLQAYGTCFRIF